MLSACGPSPQPSAFRATGEILALSGGNAGAEAACVTCHGLAGEGDGRLAPRLAGLDAGYLHRQMDDFVTGRRDHKLKRHILRQLDGDDRTKVAAYFAGLSPPTAPSPAASEPIARSSTILEQGKILYQQGDPRRAMPSCASCHGAAGEGQGAANPPLAGQSADYIAAQLYAWKNGKRHNDALQQMQNISKKLTSKEIAAISHYSAQF